jgi:hypothetical protein
MGQSNFGRELDTKVLRFLKSVFEAGGQIKSEAQFEEKI